MGKIILKIKSSLDSKNNTKKTRNANKMEVKQYGVRALMITPTEVYFQCPFKCADHKIYGKVPRTRKLPAKVHQVKTIDNDLNDHIVQVFSVRDCPKFPDMGQLNIVVDILTLRHTPPKEEEATVASPPTVKEVKELEYPERTFESPRKDNVRTDVANVSDKEISLLLKRLAYRFEKGFKKEQRTKKDDDAIQMLTDLLGVHLKLVIYSFVLWQSFIFRKW